MYTREMKPADHEKIAAFYATLELQLADDSDSFTKALYNLYQEANPLPILNIMR